MTGTSNETNWFHRTWNSPWFGAPLWTMAAALSAYWSCSVPSPGKAVGALAVVAGIMSVREMKVIGKVLWTAILVVMLLIEFRAIDQDRAENEKKQREFYEAQKSSFQSIATQAGENFTSTMRTAEKTFAKAEEASENSTGGNSFIFVQFDPRSQMFIALKRGNAPLREVTMQISSCSPLDGYDQNEMRSCEIKRYNLRDIELGQGLVNRNLDFYNVDLYPTGPFHMTKGRAYISVSFAALNGTWREVEWLRKDPHVQDASTPWLHAIRVFKSVSPKEPNKIIYEDINPHFPREAMKEHQ